MNNQTTTGSRTPAGTKKSAFIGFIVFAVMTGALFIFHEISLVRTCIDIVQVIGSNDIGWCISGHAVTDATSLAGGSAVTEEIESAIVAGASREALLYTLGGAVLGSCLAFLLLSFMPADQIRLEGNFEKFGGRIKFGGAIAIVLVMMTGGGWLSWTVLPEGTENTIRKRAFNAVMKAHGSLVQKYTDLSGQYTALAKSIEDNEETIVLEMIRHRHILPYTTVFDVQCGDQETDDVPEQIRQLMINVSGIHRSDEVAEPSVTSIPLDKLSADFRNINVKVVHGERINKLNIIDMDHQLGGNGNIDSFTIKTTIQFSKLREYCKKMKEFNSSLGAGYRR